jgi:8-oxo-dGTP diphosphatase
MMARPVTPLITVDTVITLIDRAERPVVLIERANPPSGYALPGGFVDIGETLEQAACREAMEETGLSVELIALLGCYSDPERDVRGHTISVIYVAEASGMPKAADDARSIRLCDPTDGTIQLAFDHRLVLDDFLCYRRSGIVPALRVKRPVLHKPFA